MKLAPPQLAASMLAVLCLCCQARSAHAQPEHDYKAGLPDGVDPHDLDHTIGHDVAADPDKLFFGYTPTDGFHLRSQDGAYLLRIAFQMGLKVEPSWTDGDHVMNGTFAFLRPILRGNLFRPWLEYRLSMELGRSDPFVLDAHFDVHPWEEFGFRFGQQGTPVSRHESFGPTQIFFPDFAGVATYFWAGRERGLTLFGTLLRERLDYYAGVYSGSPIDSPVNLSDNYVVEGRLTANPMGPANPNELPFTPEGEPLPTRISFTAQGYHGRLQTNLLSYNVANNILQPDASLNTERISSASGDIWFQANRLLVFGEFYWRKLRQFEEGSLITSYGAWGQAIVNVYRNLLGAGTRFNWLDPNRDVASDHAYELEGQVAYFIYPPELVLKLRYGWLFQKTPPATGDGVRLPFAEGKSHIATLQLNVVF